MSSNTSLSLNIGDAFAITCNGISGTLSIAGISPIFILMFATSSTTNPEISLAYTTASQPNPVFATISVSGGTLIYDSYSGTRSTWSHWMITNSMMAPVYQDTTSTMGRGILNVYIPYLISTDAGTLYCFFSNSFSTTAPNLAASAGFTLSLTTKSTLTLGVNGSNKMLRNKYLEYSMAMLGASKLIM